jgi:hypothetical protein
MENVTANNSKLIRNVLIGGGIAGLLYFLYKSGKLKPLEKLTSGVKKKNAIRDFKKLSESTDLIGDGFKSKPSGSGMHKGIDMLVDSLKIASNNFVIYFYPYSNEWEVDGKKRQLYQVWSVFRDKGGNKPTGVAGEIAFIGKWKLKGNKLEMSILDSGKKSYNNLYEAKGLKKYSGTLTQILQKATGSNDVLLDALGKNKGK